MKRNKLAAAVSIALGVSPLSLLAQDIQVPQIERPVIEEVIVFGEFVPDEKDLDACRELGKSVARRLVAAVDG